jgi:hypothetical protein
MRTIEAQPRREGYKKIALVRRSLTTLGGGKAASKLIHW